MVLTGAFGRWLGGKLSPSPAIRLQKRQRKHPPRRIPGDWGKWSYEFVESRLPVATREAFESGRAVIGEVGIAEPGAFVQEIGDGYLIEVFTGLPEFFYSISRAIHSQARFHPADATSPETLEPVDLDRTVAAIETILRTYERTRKVAKPAGYPISKEQKEFASALTDHAVAFLVAHEIGHVQIWETSPDAPRRSTPEFELKADEIALTIVLGMLGEQPLRIRRMAYAGAEFAVRVFAGLEHLGVRFDQDTHPLPTDRLEAIRAAALKLCGSRRQYVRLIPPATTYDQFLEELERRIAGPQKADFVVGPNPDRLLSFIASLIEQRAKGGITELFAIAQLEIGFAASPFDNVRRAVAEAAHMFLIEAFAEDPNGLAMVEAAEFGKVADRISEPWHSIFDQALIATIGG
ncbi:MAG TPA: hypothetical protein VFW35_05170 [Sphingomicrobium sp.]|nr:hypothetical protein [Sphingomicrobium sp.]